MPWLSSFCTSGRAATQYRCYFARPPVPLHPASVSTSTPDRCLFSVLFGVRNVVPQEGAGPGSSAKAEAANPSLKDIQDKILSKLSAPRHCSDKSLVVPQASLQAMLCCRWRAFRWRCEPRVVVPLMCVDGTQPRATCLWRRFFNVCLRG